MADQACVVSMVEGPVSLPFDATDKQDRGVATVTVDTDEIDLGVVLPVPPSTDGFQLRPTEFRGDSQQGLPDHWFHGAAAPGRLLGFIGRCLDDARDRQFGTV